MISYYDDFNINEIICYNEKLALITENTPFKVSNDKTVSDIGKIDDFYIIDVRKIRDFYIHITSLNFLDFKQNFEIEKIENILKKKARPAILNISKNSSNKKEKIVKLIQSKFPCELVYYYISRFGLLLVFPDDFFEKNTFQKKLTEKCINCNITDVLPISLLAKYQILNKTFIWLYFPEDLAIIQNNFYTKNYLNIFDTTLLFKQLFEFRNSITTPDFEIFKDIYPLYLPSIYFSIKEDYFSLYYFTEKKTEKIEDKNILALLNDYSRIVCDIKRKN